MDLREALQRHTLIEDGAMGTLLYSNGIDRCFEELNISHSEEVLNTPRLCERRWRCHPDQYVWSELY
ncbi:hypothetical protein HFA01_32740 [Halobacillus faecis]|uniref:Hcy-binding domain-containing protein n=1 Tax=Halobacillus faecis TaxID=360184 RepID=A0A511WYY1_9BACI|nr:hypothetical protein HFA01_32740 [Halobacillus faecis]